MSINFAILGILSYKSMAGYDIKKIIQEVNFMHWSGNNNQIYKSLSDLLDKGWVTNKIMHQQKSPTKKIYTVTSDGRAALKEWVLAPVEPSDIKKPFLVQLACSKQLNTLELKEIIDGYENQIRTQLLMHQATQQDSMFLTDGTDLETTIGRCINYNIKRSYENELLWIQEMRKAITDVPNENDGKEIGNEKEASQEDKTGNRKGRKMVLKYASYS